MARVVEGLGVDDAAHVIFGHTHRSGPWPEDDQDEWRTASGARLWNTGCWLHEAAFTSNGTARNPYWPGTVIRVHDSGEPELENVMRDVSLAG
jgi:hypothetical protein